LFQALAARGCSRREATRESTTGVLAATVWALVSVPSLPGRTSDCPALLLTRSPRCQPIAARHDQPLARRQ
ncbi:MAG: hypothetical protein ACPG4T_24260, partial [Nannocystaceae bacterium]